MNLPHDWIRPQWPAPARVRSLITTRNGGHSTGAFATLNLGLRCDDDLQAVEANRAALARHLPQPPRWLHQVHGPKAVNADALDGEVDADASFARKTGTVCAIMIADCMPVLLCDERGETVGAAHAGWRGLSAGVIENTVGAMQIEPSRLLAYLGPAIGPAAFEVGDDVRDAFMANDRAASVAFKPQGNGKWLADLFTLGRQRLAACGVTRIHGGTDCTVSDPRRFYSYRRDKTTGRMAALIWLADGPSADTPPTL
jgi:YfiH family protein